MKLPNENSHQIFKTRRVRYAGADELELYSSSSSTISPVKRRHKLIILRFYSVLFTHCRWINTSTARQECATLSLYTTALTSLHCSIRSRVEVNFVDVCGFDAGRGSPELQQVRLPVRFSRKRRLRFNLRTHITSVLLHSYTVLRPGDNSIILGRTDASRQNSATTNARSMSYRYTGVMLCQALCGVQRQLL